ncbi:MAG: phosphoribosyl-ATP diphosphatase [Thermoanaerobaculales bacterium]|jgi:phosphoribosyl-ATP pyrophosphohydrolase|nr:phosphoribosyl-ATP diphosphatase [Thermoanaerobaculales bacterium]
MIVPSIDLMEGRAVQLVGGRGEPVETADPFATAERFAVVGELAVIDLDAALGRGSNAAIMRELARRHPCRVGGGIRSVEDALGWLDAGAEKVILGTAATPDVLAELPRDRVIAALDGVDGEVVVRGWTERTGATVFNRLAELRELVGGFLVTFVEREGRLGGIDLEACRRVVEAAGGTRVTAAGGITTAAEIAALDRLGADAQVGMALYTGRLGLSEAFAAPLVSDRSDGLWPSVVCDEHGVALGLVYSNETSLAAAVAERRGVYWSRSRGGLWRKGETSGAIQELLRVETDCDRDALRFTVRQTGPGFCHRPARTCWGPDAGLPALERRLRDRLTNPVPGSYTEKLARDPALLAAKLVEEAAELAAAGTPAEVAWEAADVLYFTFATLAARGVPLEAVAHELDRRSRVTRRRDGSRLVTPGGPS